MMLNYNASDRAMGANLNLEFERHEGRVPIKFLNQENTDSRSYRTKITIRPYGNYNQDQVHRSFFGRDFPGMYHMGKKRYYIDFGMIFEIITGENYGINLSDASLIPIVVMCVNNEDVELANFYLRNSSRMLPNELLSIDIREDFDKPRGPFSRLRTIYRKDILPKLIESGRPIYERKKLSNFSLMPNIPNIDPRKSKHLIRSILRDR